MTEDADDSHLETTAGGRKWNVTRIEQLSAQHAFSRSKQLELTWNGKAIEWRSARSGWSWLWTLELALWYFNPLNVERKSKGVNCLINNRTQVGVSFRTSSINLTQTASCIMRKTQLGPFFHDESEFRIALTFVVCRHSERAGRDTGTIHRVARPYSRAHSSGMNVVRYTHVGFYMWISDRNRGTWPRRRRLDFTLSCITTYDFAKYYRRDEDIKVYRHSLGLNADILHPDGEYSWFD